MLVIRRSFVSMAAVALLAMASGSATAQVVAPFEAFSSKDTLSPDDERAIATIVDGIVEAMEKAEGADVLKIRRTLTSPLITGKEGFVRGFAPVACKQLMKGLDSQNVVVRLNVLIAASEFADKGGGKPASELAVRALGAEGPGGAVSRYWGASIAQSLAGYHRREGGVSFDEKQLEEALKSALVKAALKEPAAPAYARELRALVALEALNESMKIIQSRLSAHEASPGQSFSPAFEGIEGIKRRFQIAIARDAEAIKPEMRKQFTITAFRAADVVTRLAATKKIDDDRPDAQKLWSVANNPVGGWLKYANEISPNPAQGLNTDDPSSWALRRIRLLDMWGDALAEVYGIKKSELRGK